MLNPTDSFVFEHTRVNSESEMSEEIRQEVWLHTLEARARRKSLMFGLVVRRAHRSARGNLCESGGTGSAVRRVHLEPPALTSAQEASVEVEPHDTALLRTDALHRLLEAVYESADARGDRENVEALLELYRTVPKAPPITDTTMHNVWRRTLGYAAKAKARLVASGAWDDLIEALA